MGPAAAKHSSPAFLDIKTWKEDVKGATFVKLSWSKFHQNLISSFSFRLSFVQTHALIYSSTVNAHLLWRHQLTEHRARTFAAGVVSRVQDLVVRTSTLPASRRGEAKAAAPAIVDATRVGACGQTSSTGLLSRIEPTGTNKQTEYPVCIFRHLAAAERHTCGFQRWAASRFSAT